MRPRFHSTPASGTLPTEQTKLSTATAGGDQGPDESRERPVAGEEDRLPERPGHPRLEGAGDEHGERDVAQHGRPLHHEDVRDGREPLRAGEAPPPRPSVVDRQVHRGVTLHGTWTPQSACCWARATASSLTTRRIAIPTKPIITRPPTSSARVNRHPSSSHITMPISNTRLVLAIWKAIAEAREAPLRTASARGRRPRRSTRTLLPPTRRLEDGAGPLVAQRTGDGVATRDGLHHRGEREPGTSGQKIRHAMVALAARAAPSCSRTHMRRHPSWFVAGRATGPGPRALRQDAGSGGHLRDSGCRSRSCVAVLRSHGPHQMASAVRCPPIGRRSMRPCLRVGR